MSSADSSGNGRKVQGKRKAKVDLSSPEHRDQLFGLLKEVRHHHAVVEACQRNIEESAEIVGKMLRQLKVLVRAAGLKWEAALRTWHMRGELPFQKRRAQEYIQFVTMCEKAAKAPSDGAFDRAAAWRRCSYNHKRRVSDPNFRTFTLRDVPAPMYGRLQEMIAKLQEGAREPGGEEPPAWLAVYQAVQYAGHQLGIFESEEVAAVNAATEAAQEAAGHERLTAVLAKLEAKRAATA